MSGLRCRVFWRYNVARVATELVAAVLSKAPSAPCWTAGCRSSAPGSSGEAERRSTTQNAGAIAIASPSSTVPRSWSPGRATTVAPTTIAMTVAVSRAALTTFSVPVRSRSRSDGTERKTAAASRADSGRYAQKMTRQLVRSLTTPPTTKPLAPAAAPAALQAATARCALDTLGGDRGQQAQGRRDRGGRRRALDATRRGEHHDRC